MGLRRTGRRFFVGASRCAVPPLSMNKADLINEVRKRLGTAVSKAAAERAVDAVLGAVGHGLKLDREVQLVGFGAFAVATRAARRGYNPHTQRPMKIRAMKQIRFKAGLDLKGVV